MVATTRRGFTYTFGAFLILYLTMPILAAIFEIGDRRGPRIYPVWLHEPIYKIVWVITPHDESKPRVRIGSNRPMFYGCNAN